MKGTENIAPPHISFSEASCDSDIMMMMMMMMMISPCVEAISSQKLAASNRSNIFTASGQYALTIQIYQSGPGRLLDPTRYLLRQPS